MNRASVVLAIGPIPPPISGMTKAFELVALGLPALGWTVEVVDTSDHSAGRANGAFSLHRLRSVFVVLFSAAKRMRMVDVVYVTIAQSRLGFAKDVILLTIASLMGHRPVVHMHGGNFGNFYRSLNRVERWIVRRTLDRTSRIIVLTQSLKADFDMTRDWVQRTVAISNACDTTPGRPRVAPLPGALRVLYLSNLVVSKGYRDVIRAVGLLSRRCPQLRLRLDLAGALAQERDFPDDEAQASDLRSLLADLPPQVTATYHGVVRGQGKAELLAETDVFVLPTSYPNEGQPIAVLEGLTAGLPVISVDWRGIRESMPPAMYDLFVPPGAPEAIADRLQMLLDDAAAYEARSRAGIQHAGAFNPARHLAAIDAVLRQASRDRHQ